MEATVPTVPAPPTRATLRALGPGLRRRSDNTVGLADCDSSEDGSFDMDSDSHSATRGYAETASEEEEDDGTEAAPVAPPNLCVVCKVDMGFGNPRQLCGKTFCDNVRDDSSE